MSLVTRQAMFGARRSAMLFRPLSGLVRNICRPVQLRTTSVLSQTMVVRSFSSGNEQVKHYLERDEVRARVLEVMRGYDKVDESKITDTAVFGADMGLDSLDTVEVVMQLEDEFDIEISDANAEAILSVGDAIDYICKHPFAK